jgi:hypothetical protein
VKSSIAFQRYFLVARSVVELLKMGIDGILIVDLIV